MITSPLISHVWILVTSAVLLQGIYVAKRGISQGGFRHGITPSVRAYESGERQLDKDQRRERTEICFLYIL